METLENTDTKYDFLVTEVSDKIIECINLLKEDNILQKDTLRNIYNEYLHPEILNTEDKRIWEHLAAGDILDVFQFNTGVGLAIAKKLKPQNPMEMTAANAMMRLMSEKDQESQQDRYFRIKTQGIEAFDQEMREYNLSEDFINLMHKHCDKYYGCCPLQEQMMEALMDIANFSLGEANNARKIVAKKKMDKIPELHQKVLNNFTNQNDAKYFWTNIVAPQLGYAFSICHSLPYSFVGIQTIFLATAFNPIYWDTSCLIVNSGSLEDHSEEEVVDIYEPEGGDLASGITFIDMPDKKEKIRKTASTDYGKMAKAIGDIRNAGISVSLANINQSEFGFAPDVKNNRILFGLKGILNVGDELVEEIIKKRPYASPKDFINKIRPGKQAMIALIKGGAFDDMIDRKLCMGWYLWETCDKKKRITLQNMAGLIKYDLLPDNTPEERMAKRVYDCNKFLKSNCKINTEYYQVNTSIIDFLNELDKVEILNEDYTIKIKEWDKKVYQPYMDIFRNWISENKEEILNSLNTCIFKEDWNKYAKGSLSSWEMEVLCFYYHEHELIDVDIEKYGLSDFFKLPKEPVIDKVITTKKGSQIKLFKLSRICGTCIAKNKIHSSVTLLTTSGVVEVKFRKEYFSLFDKQLSEKGEDGVKHVVEKSWFNRGNMIVVQGFRSGDNFIPKKYAYSDLKHQLYKIQEINQDTGEIVLQDERYKSEDED